MKKTILIPVLLGLATTAHAGNLSDRMAAKVERLASPTAVGTYDIYSAQQYIGLEQCTYNIYRIRGEVTGVDNDTGTGFDEIEFQVWDDGALKDSETITVAVGMTANYDITLQFEGIYGSGAPGVGLYSEIGLSIDPFYPEDVIVEDCEQALKCWVTPTTANAGDEVTVHAKLNLTEPGVTMTAYSISLVPVVNMYDLDGDGEYTGSFTVNQLSHRGPHLYPVRATIGEDVYWCPGFRKTPTDFEAPDPQ